MLCTYPSGWAKHTNSSSQGHAQEEKGERRDLIDFLLPKRAFKGESKQATVTEDEFSGTTTK